MAAQRSHLGVVRCLLDHGADDTLPNKEGKVPKRTNSGKDGYIHRCSMYGIFTYVWLKFMVNVGKYSIHGTQ